LQGQCLPKSLTKLSFFGSNQYSQIIWKNGHKKGGSFMNKPTSDKLAIDEIFESLQSSGDQRLREIRRDGNDVIVTIDLNGKPQDVRISPLTPSPP
jgi:hypothetical protein